MTIELRKQEGTGNQWTVRHHSDMGDIRYQINLTADEALWSVVSIMTNTGFGYLKTNSQHDADKEKFGSAFAADARAILGFEV